MAASCRQRQKIELNCRSKFPKKLVPVYGWCWLCNRGMQKHLDLALEGEKWSSIERITRKESKLGCEIGLHNDLLPTQLLFA